MTPRERIGGQAERDRKIAVRRLEQVSARHAACGAIARHARAGLVPLDRAVTLIEAIVEGHAVPHWVVSIDGSGARLTITADPDAPEHVRAMLTQAQCVGDESPAPEGPDGQTGGAA